MTEPEDLNRQQPRETWQEKVAHRSVSAEKKYAEVVDHFQRRAKWRKMHPALRWVIFVFFIVVLAAVAGVFFV